MSLEDRHNDVSALVRQIFSGVDISNEGPLRFVMKFHSGQMEEGPLFSIEFDVNLSKLTIDELNGTWSDDLHNETVLLEKVDELVREVPTCKTIELRLDDNELTTQRCGHKINLVALNIFETGESFYNQFGYRKPSYNGDKQINAKNMEMPVRDAMKLVVGGNFSKYDKYDYNFMLNTYIKRTFKSIKDLPKEKCDDESVNERAKMAAYHINAFGKLLKYPDSGIPFTKDIQFEQQKIIIREAVHKLCKGFVIEESGGMRDYFSSVIYMSRRPTKNCDL